MDKERETQEDSRVPELTCKLRAESKKRTKGILS
jgi:hypothetical protein